jgi:hypothetical protein
METSRKTTTTLTLAIILLMILSSCKSEEDPLRLADKGLERTDITITGDLNLDDFRQIEESDPTTDLISYNFYGMNSKKFDFVVNLADGHSLTIQVYDAQRLNPWQQVGLPYNIYPGQDLEDKLYYTNVKFGNLAGETLYSTNFDSSIPHGTFIDVFKIISRDGDQIQCRIRDMILYKSGNTNRTIEINGTFMGVINLDF